MELLLLIFGLIWLLSEAPDAWRRAKTKEECDAYRAQSDKQLDAFLHKHGDPLGLIDQ